MSSLRLPSLSPKMKAPTEPARAPNKELLTTRPDRKGDKLYLHWTEDQRCFFNLAYNSSHTCSLRSMGAPRATRKCLQLTSLCLMCSHL